MKKIFGIVLLIIIALYFGNKLLSPKQELKSTKQSVIGTILVEKSIPVAETKIDSAGGKVVVLAKDNPITGLEIDIPANSYKDAREFKVSYSKISSHTFGEDFNPVTPLISIDNGGGYSENLMEVKIPVTVPADSFAMGFIYNNKTNTLEGLPIIAQDGSSMTVATRHFTDIIVSVIANAKLKNDIDTGFRLGMDDWQFVNRGSYIAPGGHCAGQSLSLLWYYTVQPDGKDLALYNRYDNNGNKPETPTIWEDDNLGYRFASTIQQDIDWGGFAFKLWKAQRGVSDDFTWKLFAYSMQLTGEPQLVGLTKEGVGGHAMVAYRLKDDELYIADPNYPGDLERRIKFVNGKIEPYNSGANANEIEKGNGISFDKVGFTGKTTIIDWSGIPARWAEFKSKTIGDNRFPGYKMVISSDKDKTETILNDGYVSSEKLIRVYPDSKAVKVASIYRDGKEIDRGEIELFPGNNNLGFAIYGDVDGNSEYVDFKRLNIVYEAKEAGKPNITSVSPNPAKVGDTITISGSNLGEGPRGQGLNYSDLFVNNNYSPQKTISWTNNQIVFVLKTAPGSDSKLSTARGDLKFKINMAVESSKPKNELSTQIEWCDSERTMKDYEYKYKLVNGEKVKVSQIEYYCPYKMGVCEGPANTICAEYKYDATGLKRIE